jgi:hypothetical protein
MYELAYDGHGTDGAPFLPGLAAIDAEGSATTSASRGSEANFAPAGRAADAPQTPGGRGSDSTTNSRESAVNPPDAATVPESSRPGANGAAASYAPPSPAAG